MTPLCSLRCKHGERVKSLSILLDNYFSATSCNCIIVYSSISLFICHASLLLLTFEICFSFKAFECYYFFTASTWKYLYSGWPTGVQYFPYCFVSRKKNSNILLANYLLLLEVTNNIDLAIAWLRITLFNWQWKFHVM